MNEQRAGAQGPCVHLTCSNKGAATAAAELLRVRSPGHCVVGCHCLPLGFDLDPGPLACIRVERQQTEPDVVFVALGGPKYEGVISLYD